mmetsp:Transcript_7462/g.18877  ORF Transcript_7462/g.18877 Transcript_7462/m.18877 type:complete len:306 (+) Transcript_7462:1356-2273(+)
MSSVIVLTKSKNTTNHIPTMKLILNREVSLLKSLSALTFDGDDDAQTPTESETHHSQDDEESSTASSSQSSAFPSSPVETQSVLIIGATGKTGVETIRQLAKAEHPPMIYGMTRDLSTTPQETMDLYMKHGEALLEGDPTSAADIYRALQMSNADTIIVIVGTGRRLKTSIRTASAEALAQVLQHPPFRNTRVVVVSWRSKKQALHLGLVDKLLERSLRSVLEDHVGQERIFTTDKTLRERTTIVRPTSLTSKTGTELKRVSPQDPVTTSKTSRQDLAEFVAKEALQASFMGSVINVTSVKSRQR